MANLGHGLHFPPEPLNHCFGLSAPFVKGLKPFPRDNLDRNVAIQVGLVCPIDFTHSPFVDEAKDHPFAVEHVTDFEHNFA